MRRDKSTPTRRTLLSAIGTGFTAGLLGTGATATRRQSQYVLVQGDECVPIRPMRLQQPVETFYDYQLPQKYVSDANGASVGDTARYASAGTMDLQRSQTSIVFLYQGPEGLSLVVVHGSVRNSDAGAVTFRISGLPEDGRWVVKDDLYRDPDTGELASSNYDRWQVEGTDHRIDWTWGSSGTDGGAFRDLGEDFEVVVDPAFNEESPLHGEHYEGTVTDWEFLSGSADAPDRISLSMDQPIRIATGSCEQAGDAGGRQREQGAGGDREDDTEEGEKDETEEQEEDETEEQEQEEDETEEQAEEDSEQYTVCHKPPGNPENARTIQVGSRSALESHLAHGDSRGPCSEDG
jgi:hypothetical protein